jgi:hypothetical protein
MPSNSRRGYVTVEVKPDSAKKPSNLAPSSPTPGSPGKTVRFETAAKAEPREPSNAESWSFYHFECHARQCPECRDPLDRRALCQTGHSLAQDVAEHVYRRDGVVYSKQKDNYKLVEINMPRDYNQTAQLLRSMEKALRDRKAPIISYDRTYPVAPRRTEDDEYDENGRREVIIEPASSKPTRHSSKHKSARYSTVVINDDVERSAPKERRGSLYYEDMSRRRKEGYKVEIRTPESSERKERRRHKNEIYL